MVYKSNRNSHLIRSHYQTYRSAQTKVQIKYPFRVLAFLLSIGIIIELIALIQLPSFKDDVEKARYDYLIAQSKNLQLSKELDIALQQSTVEESARKQGMAYYGETIYIPVIDNDTANTEIPQ